MERRSAIPWDVVPRTGDVALLPNVDLHVSGGTHGSYGEVVPGVVGASDGAPLGRGERFLGDGESTVERHVRAEVEGHTAIGIGVLGQRNPFAPRTPIPERHPLARLRAV